MARYIVKLSLRGGQVIKFRCSKFNIQKQNNDLSRIEYEGVNRKGIDKLFYTRLDAIDHIYIRQLVFGLF